MQAIFVDAWAWIAMAHEGDQWHELAAAEARRLADRGARLVTRNLALCEAYTGLARWASHDTVEELRDRVVRSALDRRGLSIVYADSALEGLAWDIFSRHRDSRFSFPDCVAFALMRREGIQTAFTGDRHFRQMGFSTVPAELPASGVGATP